LSGGWYDGNQYAGNDQRGIRKDRSAERPGMYIVQALYWMHDVMDQESELA